MTTKSKATIKIRRIVVREGDVFDNYGFGGFIVETMDGGKAYGRYSNTGRATAIKIERLQRNYKRLGEIDALACHRSLAKIDARRRAAKVKGPAR